MNKKHESTEVDILPHCDFCTGKFAKYDFKCQKGGWARACEKCFYKHDGQLGLGKGQELIVKNNLPDTSAYTLHVLPDVIEKAKDVLIEKRTYMQGVRETTPKQLERIDEIIEMFTDLLNSDCKHKTIILDDI